MEALGKIMLYIVKGIFIVEYNFRWSISNGITNQTPSYSNNTKTFNIFTILFSNISQNY